MSEQEKNSEIPQSFGASRFVLNLAEMKSNSVNLEAYIGEYLDYGNDDGEKNINEVKKLFTSFKPVFSGKEKMTVHHLAVLRQLLKGMSGIVSFNNVPSEAHQKALASAWIDFKGILTHSSGNLGYELLEDLGPIMDEIKFDKDQYAAMYGPSDKGPDPKASSKTEGEKLEVKPEPKPAETVKPEPTSVLLQGKGANNSDHYGESPKPKAKPVEKFQATDSNGPGDSDGTVDTSDNDEYKEGGPVNSEGPGDGVETKEPEKTVSSEAAERITAEGLASFEKDLVELLASENVEALKLDNLEKLRAMIEKIMGSHWTKHKSEIRNDFESKTENEVKVLLEPLLSVDISDPVKARKTPGDPRVQKTILALLGYKSAPGPEEAFKRMRSLSYGLQMASKRGDRPGVALMQEALKKAMFVLAPDDLKSKMTSEVMKPADHSNSSKTEKDSDKTEKDSNEPSQATDSDEAGVERSNGEVILDWTKKFGRKANDVLKAGKEQIFKDRKFNYRILEAIKKKTPSGSQYMSFFGKATSEAGNGGSSNPSSPSNPNSSGGGGGNNEPPTGGNGGGNGGNESTGGGGDGTKGRLDRLKEWSKNKDGKLKWKVALAMAAGTVVGTEWAIRGIGSTISTGWDLTKGLAETGINVMAAPFQGAGSGMKSGWDHVSPTERYVLPEDSPWYKKMGSSAWYRARQTARGFAGSMTGAAGGVKGAFGGSFQAGKEALGIGLSEKVSDEPMEVPAILAAVDGKVSEEAMREIAEITDPGEAVQRAIAELGEGGLKILQEAGVISTPNNNKLSDRLSISRTTGLLGLGAIAAKGAKEIMIDNTASAVQFKGWRGAASFVFGGGKMPTVTELNSYIATLTGVSDAYKGHYDTIDGNVISKTFGALAMLSPEEQLSVTRGFATTFDLDEIEGVRGALFGGFAPGLNLVSNFTHPERRFKPEYGFGMGVSLDTSQLVRFVNRPETLDKLQSEHELLFGFNYKEEGSALSAAIDSKDEYKIRYQKSQLLQLQRAIQKFVGAKKITEGSVNIYLGRIQPAIDALEGLRDSNDNRMPVAELLLGMYKNVKNVLEDDKLRPLVLDPAKLAA